MSDTEDPTNDVRQIVTPQGPEGQAGPNYMEVYRDLSAFVYRDAYNHQHLSQWLISEDGMVYWNRECDVGDKNGPDWRTCTRWDHAHDVAELGLVGFGAIAGMNTYVWTEPVGHYSRQWLAQSAFNERGDMRMGRVCPIDRTPQYHQCTDWNKLAIDTEDLMVPGARTLRDDMYFAYQNSNNEAVIVQNVLSIDGSLMWDRHCVTDDANPFINTRRCEFSERTPLRDYGLGMGSVAGAGQYVYTDGAAQKLGQTFFNVDGTKAYRRSCTITNEGVDWRACGPFTATITTQLRLTQAAL